MVRVPVCSSRVSLHVSWLPFRLISRSQHSSLSATSSVPLFVSTRACSWRTSSHHNSVESNTHARYRVRDSTMRHHDPTWKRELGRTKVRREAQNTSTWKSRRCVSGCLRLQLTWLLPRCPIDGGSQTWNRICFSLQDQSYFLLLLLFLLLFFIFIIALIASRRHQHHLELGLSYDAVQPEANSSTATLFFPEKRHRHKYPTHFSCRFPLTFPHAFSHAHRR